MERNRTPEDTNPFRFDHKRVINHLKEARWIASIVVVITEIDQTNGKASVRKFVPVEWQG